MTLITHFKNKKLSVIAGDTLKITYYDYGRKTLKEQQNKVFLIQDGIVGYFGNNSGVYIDLFFSNKANQKLLTLDELLIKCNEHHNESPKINSFSLVISTFHENILYKWPEKKIYNFGSNAPAVDNDLGFLITRKVFFSPTRNDNNKIDLDHNEKLLELFDQCFRKVFNMNFELDLVDDDSKLDELLNAFYFEINKVPSLNKGVIGYPVRYFVLDFENKSISDIR